MQQWGLDFSVSGFNLPLEITVPPRLEEASSRNGFLPKSLYLYMCLCVCVQFSPQTQYDYQIFVTIAGLPVNGKRKLGLVFAFV